MEFLKIRKIYLKDTFEKFQRQYEIDLKSWHNPYKKFKYIFINEAGAIFSFIFFKFNIKPNYITFLNILSALTIFLIFSLNINNYYYLGLFLIFSKNILDNVDGFIARVKKQTSKFGDRLDYLSAKIYYYVILSSFFIHSVNLKNNFYLWILFIFIIVLDLANPGKKLSKKKKKTKVLKLKKNKLLRLLAFFNYDGRTNIVDFMVLIMLSEFLLKKIIFSYILCFLFALIKISRNFFYSYKL